VAVAIMGGSVVAGARDDAYLLPAAPTGVVHAGMSPAHGVDVIELRHLRALKAIAAHGGLTAAARALHCTQSALSHLIAELERQERLPLLRRGVRPLRLSEAGSRLLRAADAILPQVAALDEDLERLRRGTDGRLLLLLECHSCFDWLVPVMDRYRADHPAVELDLRLGASFDPLPALNEGVVDLVITSERERSPGVQADALFRYQIVAVLPPGHPLAKRERVQPKDFSGQALVTYPVEECRLDLFTRFLEPAAVQPGRRRTAELTAMIVQVVAGGHALAALPQWAVQDAVARGTVVTRPLGRGLWAEMRALRRAEQEGVPYIDDFITLARGSAPRADPEDVRRSR
jgi:LysR family transcriptional regulator, regulator for metE and metH